MVGINVPTAFLQIQFDWIRSLSSQLPDALTALIETGRSWS